MDKVINLAVIRNRRLFFVKKKGIWVLPGGRLRGNENYEECLRREIQHNLGTIPVVGDYYGDFSGRIHHGKDFVKVRVYFGSFEEIPEPRGEIKEARELGYISYEKSRLSNITRNIVLQLRKDDYIR